MKYAVNNCVVLSKAPEGPLAEYVEAFADSLSEQGYVPYSIHRMVLLAACFSGWLERQRVVLSGITSEHPPRYLQYRTQQVRSHRGDAAALGHLLNFLRRKGAIPAEKISKYSLTPAECY